jgi:hypothetical protein
MTTGPTLDGKELSEADKHFSELMRCIEYRESEQTIEALKLPKEYIGKQINAQTNITTEIQWFKTLHQLLDELEKETIKSFADNHISALFSYVFTSVSLEGRIKPPTYEEHYGP